MISYSFNLFAAIQASAWACGRCDALWQVKWKPREISSSYKTLQGIQPVKKKYFFPLSFLGADRWKKKGKKSELLFEDHLGFSFIRS